MPSLRDTIQPFVDRLLRDPGALMTDPAFFRSFNSLGLPLRVAVMDRVEAVRRQQMDRSFERQHRDIVRMVSVDTGANGDATTVVSGHLSTDRHGISTVTIDEVEELTRSDEENARFDRIAEMRRDMAREMERYRENMVRLYQQRPPSLQTRSDFEAWSREVEASVAGIRARWEMRIAEENGGGVVEMPAGAVRVPPQPTRPTAQWPDPADYGPNAGYRSVRGALSAFTRAVNNAYAAMFSSLSNMEERDHIHINGTMEIRSLWRGRQEMPRSVPVPPPPPTTTAWVDEPEVDELDIMIKHLPRNRKWIGVATINSHAARDSLHAKFAAAGFGREVVYVFDVRSFHRVLDSFRSLRACVLIDPAVFKMHAKREGDWTDEQLDAIIELQGEIPDEEDVRS